MKKLILALMLFLASPVIAEPAEHPFRDYPPASCFLDYLYQSNCKELWGIDDPNPATPINPAIVPRRPTKDEEEHYNRVMATVWYSLKSLDPALYAAQMEILLWNSRQLLEIFNEVVDDQQRNDMIKVYTRNRLSYWGWVQDRVCEAPGTTIRKE